MFARRWVTSTVRLLSTDLAYRRIRAEPLALVGELGLSAARMTPVSLADSSRRSRQRRCQRSRDLPLNSSAKRRYSIRSFLRDQATWSRLYTVRRAPECPQRRAVPCFCRGAGIYSKFTL